jgi:lipase maturation factor 1
MSKFRDSLFQRLFAIIASIAILGLGLELKLLFLKNGIVPIETLYFRFNGFSSFLKIPSLFCFLASDWFIWSVLVFAGLSLVILASHIFRNRFIRALFFLIFYICYLSFVNFGEPFMSFQWDALLLESSFLFVIYLFLSQDTKLAKVNIWFFRILVFKLMLMSGLVKIFSGDKSWLDMTALEYHYFSQPLPNFLSFFVHSLPIAFHKLSCLLMFTVELVLPFFIFFGKRLREFAAWAFIVLQVLIFFTGNYGFFNLLTIVLCFSLFDFQSSSQENFKFQKTFRYISVIVLALYGLVSLSLIFSRVKVMPFMLKPAQIYYKTLGRLHICNPYGLFAMMTKKRGEIVIQGGRKIPGEFGVEWKDYKLRYKPQDLKLLPMQIAPLQPRLDWQMWFAALSSYKRNLWFLKLAEKLLNGEKDVTSAFALNPYEGSKPDLIRALYFDYKFNDFSDYLKTKDVWRRTYTKVYLPEVSLKK